MHVSLCCNSLHCSWRLTLLGLLGRAGASPTIASRTGIFCDVWYGGAWCMYIVCVRHLVLRLRTSLVYGVCSDITPLGTRLRLVVQRLVRVQLRRRLCYTPTMRHRKTGYAVEESVRGSVSVDALQKLEYCYAAEESVRGSA